MGSVRDVFVVGDIEAAKWRIAEHAVHTPLLADRGLSALTGADIYLKAESLQVTGSFKFRGAVNMIAQLTKDERRRGVVAYSTGNHAAAVAAAAQNLVIAATLIVPISTPQAKLDNIRTWGGEIVTYDPDHEDRVAIAESMIAGRGLTLIPPFDHHAIMAGAGTVGLEIAEDLGSLEITPDAIVVSCSGGGLAAGAFTALRDAYPGVALYIAEPEGRDKMARSLAAGTPQASPTKRATFMDAIAGPSVGERTLAVLLHLNVNCLTVNDQQVEHAMRSAQRYLNIVVEPGGAAALAATLAYSDIFAGKRVVVVSSGGNVDQLTYAEVLTPR